MPRARRCQAVRIRVVRCRRWCAHAGAASRARTAAPPARSSPWQAACDTGLSARRALDVAVHSTRPHAAGRAARRADRGHVPLAAAAECLMSARSLVASAQCAACAHGRRSKRHICAKSCCGAWSSYSGDSARTTLRVPPAVNLMLLAAGVQPSEHRISIEAYGRFHS